MKIYWSIKSIPELADMSKERRKEIWKLCHLKYSVNLLILVLRVAIILVCCAIGLALGCFYSNHITIVFTWAVIVGTIVSTIGNFIIWQVEIALVKPNIREYLISHGKTN